MVYGVCLLLSWTEAVDSPSSPFLLDTVLTPSGGGQGDETIPEAVLLGTGVLNWPASERISDRYGLVGLWNAPMGEDEKPIDLIHLDVGIVGTLKVKVLETRQSLHIGDLARRIPTSIPKVDSVIVLGTGMLFYHRYKGEDFDYVGVEPTDPEKEYDWLDPHQLYKVHQQTVELWFEPEGESDE